jgi:mono/diheme cytochrome c family protein
MNLGTKTVRRASAALAVGAAAAVAALPATAANPGNVVKGKALFKKNCGSCHTLKAAGTMGALNNLDKVRPTYAKAITVITNGSTKNPVMISWKTTLTKSQIQDLAAFIAKSVGR